MNALWQGATFSTLRSGSLAAVLQNQWSRPSKRALDGHTLGYTEALGLPELRHRVALYYGERYGVALDWRRVAITSGSSAAFLLCFLAAFDIGDRVGLASPGYPAYRNIRRSGSLRWTCERDRKTDFNPHPI